jgi:general secretion pathway protein B
VSLILDALRKAESERPREAVPGLHTQPAPPLSLEHATAPVRPRPWLWIALGVGVGLLVAVVWYLAGRDAPRLVAERPLPVPAPVAAAPARESTAPPNAMTPEPAREVAAPAPWPSQERKVAPKVAKVESSAPATLPATYAREQLPDNIRAALPPLAVGGSIYSNTPANRSLILDGKLYRENEPLSADLMLEEIGQKTAVLRFKDYRFQIRY